MSNAGILSNGTNLVTWQEMTGASHVRCLTWNDMKYLFLGHASLDSMIEFKQLLAPTNHNSSPVVSDDEEDDEEEDEDEMLELLPAATSSQTNEDEMPELLPALTSSQANEDAMPELE